MTECLFYYSKAAEAMNERTVPVVLMLHKHENLNTIFSLCSSTHDA